MKRLVAAEDRLSRDTRDPKSLQRRIDDFATRYQEGDPDDLLSLYPRELFEPKPEPLRETAVDGGLETWTGIKQPPKAESVLNRL
jgi:hypothetical protein